MSFGHSHLPYLPGNSHTTASAQSEKSFQEQLGNKSTRGAFAYDPDPMAVSDYAFHSLKEKYWISVSWPMVEGDWVSSSEKLGWIQIHRAPFLSISSTYSARRYFFPWVPSVLLHAAAKPSFISSLPSKYKCTGGLFQTKKNQIIYV